MPLKKRGIEHRIAVIDCMIKHDDNNQARWSYYDVLLKNHVALKDHVGFEEAAVRTIKSGRIKALAFRSKLQVVVRTKSEKPMQQFIDGAPLEDAVKTAKSLGGDHKALHKIKKFRQFLVEAETKAEIKSAPEKVRQEVSWELKKIRTQVTTLLKVAK